MWADQEEPQGFMGTQWIPSTCCHWLHNSNADFKIVVEIL